MIKKHKERYYIYIYIYYIYIYIYICDLPKNFFETATKENLQT